MNRFILTTLSSGSQRNLSCARMKVIETTSKELKRNTTNVSEGREGIESNGRFLFQTIMLVSTGQGELRDLASSLAI